MSNETRGAQLSQECSLPLDQLTGTKDRPAQCRYGSGRLFLSVLVHSNSVDTPRFVSRGGGDILRRHGSEAHHLVPPSRHNPGLRKETETAV